MDIYFRTYAAHPPSILREWISDSDVVILESGGPEIFFDLVRTCNANCQIIYISSDSLDTIGCSQYVVRAFKRIAPQFDGIRLPSKLLAAAFPAACKLYFVPHGIDHTAMQTSSSSPYQGGINVVSVGNMLFDITFFEIAAAACPDINFHVIGGGNDAMKIKAPNVTVYPEMQFNDTLAYLKYADAGVAPYGGSGVPGYLADTSMKLMQYGYYGLPAICPTPVVGEHSGRFGYVAGSQRSIEDSIRNALAFGRFQGVVPLHWSEVTQRILSPECFRDTFLN